MENDLITCLILLAGWLALLYGGWALSQGMLTAFHWLTNLMDQFKQRKNALSGSGQIKRQGELGVAQEKAPWGAG